MRIIAIRQVTGPAGSACPEIVRPLSSALVDAMAMHPGEIEQAEERIRRRRQERETGARRLGFRSFAAYHKRRWELDGWCARDMAAEVGTTRASIQEGGRERMGVTPTVTGRRRFRPVPGAHADRPRRSAAA